MSETASDYLAIIQRCEEFLKAGHLAEATRELNALTVAQVPRAQRLPLARLCRRGWLIDKGIDLLAPVVRGEYHKLDPPSPAEVAEYACLLSRNGSVSEALQLLGGIDPTAVQEAILFMAFAHIMRWEYDLAVPLLESYLARLELPYQRLVTSINLAAALINCEKFSQAENLLEKATEEAKKQQAFRLLGNCRELRAQIAIHQGDFTRAHENLSEAEKIFGASPTLEQLLVEKWKAIMSALSTRDPAPLLHFRETALARKNWESVREVDFFFLTINFDQRRFDHLLTGTPYPFYRERAIRWIQAMPSPVYILGDNSTWIFDLSTGRIEARKKLNIGKKIHQLLGVLLKDFYAPVRTGYLFSEIYPGEYFGENARSKISQLIFRARQWIHDNELPIQIAFDDGNYSLSFSAPVGFRIYYNENQITPMSSMVARLKAELISTDSFSAQEACQILNLSRASFTALAQEAIDGRQLLRTGSGRSTRYRII
ncbi:MAG: hypothetical protein C5B49_12700 [Bdellovibrio sp.]|nr:MAG: hypothetical protein C5B49_12700 [Bdellovibrio sp.]